MHNELPICPVGNDHTTAPLASPIEMVQSVSRKLRLTDSPDAHSTAAGGEHSRYNQLFRFLSSIGLNKFASVLIENEVDFETLLIITEAELEELGIAKGPRVKMLRTMHDWHKRDTAPDPGSETSSPAARSQPSAGRKKRSRRDYGSWREA